MNVLDIARKDLQILFRDPGQVFMTFLLPLVFVLAFGFAYSQVADADARIELPVVNLDAGGPLAGAFLEALGRQDGVRIRSLGADEARRTLDEKKIARFLTIPAGFSEDLAAGRSLTVRLLNAADASKHDSEAVFAVVDGVAKDLSLQTQLLSAFRQMGEMMTLPGRTPVFTANIVVAQAQSQYERAKTAPLVGVEQRGPQSILKGREEMGAMDIYVPGFTAMFVFLTAGTTALSIYSEKKLGTFRRLLAAPLGRGHLLAGKMVPSFLIVIAQVVVIFAVGALVMPLLGMDGVSLGNDPLAVVVVSLVVALCSTSLGVLIAALGRTQGQISGIATVALWIMAALAGAFIPQFLLDKFLGGLGRIVPQYWAIAAYTDVLVRGKDLAAISTSLTILAAFTIGFFAIAMWRFRFD